MKNLEVPHLMKTLQSDEYLRRAEQAGFSGEDLAMLARIKGDHDRQQRKWTNRLIAMVKNAFTRLKGE